MPQPVRTIFLITDTQRGGVPLVLKQRVIWLREAGLVDPIVVSIAPAGPISDELSAAGVTCLSLNAQHRHDWRVLPRWLMLLRQQRPALVVSLMAHANLLAALGRTYYTAPKYIQELHTTQAHPGWPWPLLGLIAGSADILVAPHSAVLDRMRQVAPQTLLGLLPNPLDVDRFATAAPMPATELPWPVGSPVIGYVGRFDPIKNLPVLLRAFAQVRPHCPTAHLALIGYGPEQAALTNLIRELHLTSTVHIIPSTPTPERWLASIHVLALPSQAEGFGMAVAEGLAAGCQIVASDLPPLRTILGDGRWGQLVQPGMIAPLATALSTALHTAQRTTHELTVARAHLNTLCGPSVLLDSWTQLLRRIGTGD
ncbi:MAG: glycosyltransferase [Phycisphaerae bacterium]